MTPFFRFAAALQTLAFCLMLTAGFASARRHYATSAPAATGDLQQFSTEAAAQAHCLKDTVVWLNTRTGIYHEQDMRWYGRTKQGAYVCKGEANAAGDRDTRNGQ